MACSGTEATTGFFKRFLPDLMIYNNYDENVIKKFLQRQKLAKAHLENPWGILILDDCTEDTKIFNSKLQHNLFKLGRHYKMWYIVSMQYGLDIRPAIRSNLDTVFLMRDPILSNRKKLYENYASIIPDFKLFCDLMDQVTDDHTALVIKNDARSNNWTDCVFWYKASIIHDDFRFGCKELWAYHDSRYDPNYIKRIPDEI